MADKTIRGRIDPPPGSSGTPTLSPGKLAVMSKRQIIDAIRQMNPTARAEFLAGFCERDLLQYLEHLQEVFGRPSGERGHRPALVA